MGGEGFVEGGSVVLGLGFFFVSRVSEGIRSRGGRT